MSSSKYRELPKNIEALHITWRAYMWYHNSHEWKCLYKFVNDVFLFEYHVRNHSFELEYCLHSFTFLQKQSSIQASWESKFKNQYCKFIIILIGVFSIRVDGLSNTIALQVDFWYSLPWFLSCRFESVNIGQATMWNHCIYPSSKRL